MGPIRYFLLAMSFIFVTNLSASTCQDRLLGNDFSSPSKSFDIDLYTLEEWALENTSTTVIPEHDSLEFSALAVSYLRAQYACGVDKAEASHPFEEDGSECSSVSTRRGFTLTCYLETAEGYYMTHIGFADSIKVLFSRWD